jgi:hypothetical protein
MTSSKYGGAQVFGLVLGATLVAAGIIGFFYNATFTSDESVRDAVFGILDVNAWHNLVHIGTGALTLVFALRSEAAARSWALAFGVLYVLVAAWGFIIGSGESILSIIPINTEDSVLHLILGVAGFAAYGLTAPKREPHRAVASTA